VAFQKGKDSTYTFGFIYIDQMAGLTLNYESNFTVIGDGKYLRSKSAIDSTKGVYKVRLQNNNVKVALIPESHFDELKIKPVPDWLKNYKYDTLTAARLQRWGFYYNDFGMSEKSLEYLEPGYKMDPDFKGMAVELAFAYNALERFDKAIPVLHKAIELTPKDGYIYKELSFAYLNNGEMEEAEKAAEDGIKNSKDNQMQAEIAYNVAYHFYEKKDKKKFNKWAEEAKKWAAKDTQIYKTIIYLEDKIKE
jgi:tetratricopeptide (TPR) repeat protein